MLYLWMMLAAGAMVALDQLTKYLTVAYIAYGETVPLLPGLIHLTYVRNTGAAFSILEGQRWFFLIVTAAFLIFLILAFKRNWFPAPMAKWALSFIAGGGIGNLVDRVSTGAVVDMFELELFQFAVFNVADLFVTFGAALLCIWVIFFDQKEQKKKEEAGHDPEL